jgi:hypothetical protein
VSVLRGEPTLRTHEGEHVLEEGDIVCFPRGKVGAHQVSNRTNLPVRVLVLSSMIRGEIIEYLDTGKVLAKDVDDEDIMFARPVPAVEYWDGEDEARGGDAPAYDEQSFASNMRSLECASVRECPLTSLPLVLNPPACRLPRSSRPPRTRPGG